MSGSREPALHEFVEGETDELLGLGPRDEDPAVEVEVEGAKGPVPEHVLDRLAVESTLGRGAHGGHRLVVLW